VLGDLLTAFVGAVIAAAEHPGRMSERDRRILAIIPDQFLGADRDPAVDLYPRVLGVTDYVAGMTDRFAVMTRERLAAL